MKNWVLALSWTALSLLFPCHAWSQTCTATWANFNFGTISSLSTTNTDITGNVSVQCSGFAQPYARVCLNLGAPGGSWNRHLTGPSSAQLSFEIYQDAARTLVWSSVYNPPATPKILDLPLSGGAGATTVPYYSRVPSGQPGQPAGSYSLNWTTNDVQLGAAGYISGPPGCTSNMPIVTGSSFTATATVAADCTISAGNANFGSQGTITQNIDVPVTASVTCTNGLSYSLLFDAGQGAGATVASRKMTRSGGTETLNYGLYIDAGHTMILGDGTNGSYYWMGTGTGSLYQYVFHAALPVQPPVKPGKYNDNPIMTITF